MIARFKTEVKHTSNLKFLSFNNWPAYLASSTPNDFDNKWDKYIEEGNLGGSEAHRSNRWNDFLCSRNFHRDGRRPRCMQLFFRPWKRVLGETFLILFWDYRICGQRRRLRNKFLFLNKNEIKQRKFFLKFFFFWKKKN